MLFSPPPKVSPINNVPVTQSLQGIPVPIVFGTARVSGKLIYDADLQAHAESAAGKAKGGKSGMYAYTGTFIAVLCQGPILGVNGIWDQNGLLPVTPYQVTFDILSQPAAAPSLSSVAGGSLGARTLYATATYTDANGESGHSAEATISLAAGHLLSCASPPSSGGATGWNLYLATSSGGEQLATSAPLALGVAYSEPSTGFVTGTIPHPPQPVVGPTPPPGSSTIVTDIGVTGPTGPKEKFPDTF